jgi:hypothetical protein
LEPNTKKASGACIHSFITFLVALSHFRFGLGYQIDDFRFQMLLPVKKKESSSTTLAYLLTSLDKAKQSKASRRHERLPERQSIQYGHGHRPMMPRLPGLNFE